MSKIITALFENEHAAADAVRALTAQGVPTGDISVVASDRVDKSAFGVETHTRLPEGAAIGAGAGGAIGALVAGFTAVGTIATGGAGLIAAGPIVAALAGAGAGATAGAGVGALVGLAIPEHEVKHYENALDKGAVLVGVNGDDRDQADVARAVFEEHGADKISSA
jgi:hypothetical protein